MTTIDFNKLMQDAGEGFTPVPPGPYHVEVSKSEATTSSTNKPQLKLQMRIIGGPHAGRIVFDTHTITADSQNALFFFFQNMAALGLDKSFFAPNPPMPQVAAALMGRQALITVGIRNDNTKWSGRNEVTAYAAPPMGQVGAPMQFAPGVGPGAVPQPPMPSVPQAPVPQIQAPAPQPGVPMPPQPQPQQQQQFPPQADWQQAAAAYPQQLPEQQPQQFAPQPEYAQPPASPMPAAAPPQAPVPPPAPVAPPQAAPPIPPMPAGVAPPAPVPAMPPMPPQPAAPVAPPMPAAPPMPTMPTAAPPVQEYAQPVAPQPQAAAPPAMPPTFPAAPAAYNPGDEEPY